LHGRSRRDGATLFLDLGTLEPFADQWAYLSSVHRLSVREVERFADRGGPIRVGTAVTSLRPATASRRSDSANAGRRSCRRSRSFIATW
jgi:hypothetical protein